jgi:hypothetical protein
MVPDSLQAGHFLGLQRVSTLLPHFSQVKTPMITPPNQLNHHSCLGPTPTMKFLVGAVREPPPRVDFNGKATVSGNRGNK